MNTKIILYNTENDKTYFKLSSGTRPWGILLAISKGSFHLSLPTLGQSHVFSPYEIAYVPPNTEFDRKVIDSIDFHQFAFQICDQNDHFSILEPGKLNIPKKQVQAILDSADKISMFPSKSDQLAEHILQRILIDSHLFSGSTSPTHISQEILWISNYILQNLCEPLSVSMLAEKLHLSHNGLIWKFKKELNVTPVKYIAMCRIKRAKQLLFDSNLTISEIAESCGYANTYYFSNAFKKSEGVSPLDFRKKCIK